MFAMERDGRGRDEQPGRARLPPASNLALAPHPTESRPRGHKSFGDSTSADKKRIIMEEQKALGNAEFKAGNYEKAIGFFTKAIELEARSSCVREPRGVPPRAGEPARRLRTRRSASG